MSENTGNIGMLKHAGNKDRFKKRNNQDKSDNTDKPDNTGLLILQQERFATNRQGTSEKEPMLRMRRG